MLRKFKIFNVSQFIFVLFIGLCASGISAKERQRPNIVIIYADDLGIGDVSSYQMGQLKTPGIDRIANEGIRFTNGYATAATCTPSRFSLLTGMYPWKNKGAAVLSGNAKAIIDTSIHTLPLMCQNTGYATAVVGKWHLGLGDGELDWNSFIALSPNEIGFDYSYIMAATNDRTPTVYVKNGKVVGLENNDPLEVSYRKNFPDEPTGKENPELLKIHPTYHHHQSINNGISRIGFMRGGKSAMWVDENMADTFLVESLRFIDDKKNEPFFLYYALHQPHVPRVPHPRFVGKSGMGPRGDVILEADWCVGKVLDKLNELKLLENTLVIFTSDNGPVLDDGYRDGAEELLGDHTPWGIYRGGKYSLFEAGIHVPFMVMWKGQIIPAVSDALVSQVDLFASLAALVGKEITGTDSKDLLDVFLGQKNIGREYVCFEGMKGRIAIRNREWALLPPYEGAERLWWGGNVESGLGMAPKLYKLSEDRGQKHNRYTQSRDVAEELMKLLEANK